MKAAMTMPALLLQRPHPRSRSADLIACLKDRMERWKKGEIDSLIHECHSTDGDWQRKRALRLITEKTDTGSLPLDSLQPDGRTVKEHLLEKPKSCDAWPKEEQILLHPAASRPEGPAQPVDFCTIDLIRTPSIPSKITGCGSGSGSSWHIAVPWACCLGGCSAIARVARRLCPTYVDP